MPHIFCPAATKGRNNLCFHYGACVFVCLKGVTKLVTVRKRSLRRLCFHRCLSVHKEEVSVSVQGVLCPGGSLFRGSLSRGVCSCHVMSCHGDLPYSNERAVRILLECILVWFVNISCNLKNSQTKLCFRTFRASLWPPPSTRSVLGSDWQENGAQTSSGLHLIYTSLSLHLPIYLSIYQSFYLSIYISLQLSIYPSLHLI